MAKTNPEGAMPHELSAEETLDRLVVEFTQQLKEIAVDLSRTEGRQLAAEHVQAAHRRIVKSSDKSRSQAQRIIALAFKENKYLEIAALLMAAALFLFGIAIIGHGVFASAEAGVRITSLAGGSLLQVLVLFPLRITVKSRQHNFAIRILGLLLERIDKPEVLATLFRLLLDTTGKTTAAQQ